MNLIRIFLMLCIIAVLLVGGLLVLLILEPKENIVVNYELRIVPSVVSNQPALVQEQMTLQEKSLQHTKKYYIIEQQREYDLWKLRKETENWNGRIANEEFTGRDERFFGSEEFQMYGEYDY